MAPASPSNHGAVFGRITARFLGIPMAEPWTEREIERLRELRQAGHANHEIAQALGRSKLSVANKANKLHIPSAYVSITPLRGPRRTPRSQVKRAGKITLPPLASLHGNT